MSLVVTLTTTPPRLPGIAPTLRSLVAQSRPADRIVLYLAKHYRRFPDQAVTVPELPDGVEVRFCDVDYGPATKILPAIAEHRGQDVALLYCDDDQIYDRDWIARLTAASARHPGAAITDRGLKVAKLDARVHYAQRGYWLARKASLGLWRPLKRYDAGADEPVDIALGFSGVLVRPEFFGDGVFEIPDVLWTVDDFWLSGQLALRGVPLIQASKRRLSRNAEAAEVASLLDSVIGGHDRDQANRRCVAYFRTQHGIWPKEPRFTRA